MTITIPAPIRELALKIKSAGGRALIVGGAVRDSLIGLGSKDFDVEVYGVQPQALQALLDESYRVEEVGKAFGILSTHIPGIEEPVDVSLPRRESKTGLGHKGFEVMSDPTMTVREAARRRDLSINALASDPLTGEIIDHFGGLADIESRTLRATDPVQFVEDPLRVLRAAQFSARLQFDADDELIELCRSLDLSELPAERIGAEWDKLLVRGVKPSLGIEFLWECDQLLHVPEIGVLEGLWQEPAWHPEGCVLTHTMLVCDAAADIARRDNLSDSARRILMYAALCHDLGKATTTSVIDGRIRSIGHTEASVASTISLLRRLMVGNGTLDAVRPLVREHLAHLNVGSADEPSPKAVRRLSKRLEPTNIHMLVRLIEADACGRGSLPKCSPAAPILRVAGDLAIKDAAPKHIVMGRHLIDLGMTPGKHFGEIIDRAYEAQLDGEFTDLAGGLEFLKLGGTS